MERIWTTTNVRYAIEKYVCLVDLAFPRGTAYLDGQPTLREKARICLVTNANHKYLKPPPNTYAIIESFSMGDTLRIPTAIGPVKVGCSYSLSREEVNALLPLCTKATVLEDLSINQPDTDPYLESNSTRWDMSKIVTELSHKGKVIVRCTNHEYRDDPRNILHIEGYEISGELPVDMLNPKSGAGKHLVNMFLQ